MRKPQEYQKTKLRRTHNKSIVIEKRGLDVNALDRMVLSPQETKHDSVSVGTVIVRIALLGVVSII